MILWFMLSNLLIIEILFNIRGITNFVYQHGVPAIFTVSSLLVFLPMYAFFALGSWFTNRWAMQSEAAATAAAQSSLNLEPLWRVLKRLLVRIVRTLQYVAAQPLFVAGFCIIGSILALSLIHNYAFGNEIPQTQVIYAKDGFNALGRAPLSLLPVSGLAPTSLDLNCFIKSHQVPSIRSDLLSSSAWPGFSYPLLAAICSLS